MLRPQNDLAAELDAAYTETLLESGNLKTRRNTDWVESNQWQSLGYSAQLYTPVCPRCGERGTTYFSGFFHTEKSASGALRAQALNARAQLPLSTPLTVMINNITQTCASCALSGFTNITHVQTKE